MNQSQLIQPGLVTSDFQVCLHDEEVQQFAEAIEWPSDRGVPPTLPVTFWQRSYPKWLADCQLPQLLKQQSFTYLQPLQTNVTYTCRITCQDVQYIQTKNGKHYLALPHRLSGEADQTLHFYADTLLYLPAPATATVENQLRMNPDVWPTIIETEGEGWELLSSLHKKITSSGIGQYARASGDLQPIHLDEQAAKQAGFTNVLAHGMYGMGMGAGVLAARMSHLTYIHSYTMQFLSPLFAGESLTISLYSQGVGVPDFLIVGAKESKKEVFRAKLSVS